MPLRHPSRPYQQRQRLQQRLRLRCGCGFLGLSCAGKWLNQQATNLTGGILNGLSDTPNFLGTPFRWLAAQIRDAFRTGATSSGQLTFNRHAGDYALHPARSPFNSASGSGSTARWSSRAEC